MILNLKSLKNDGYAEADSKTRTEVDTIYIFQYLEGVQVKHRWLFISALIDNP